MDKLIHTDSFDDIADFIEGRRKDIPQAVGIWGASGSGKTYLADKLNSMLIDSRVLHVDDYLSEEILAGPRHPLSRHLTNIEGVNPEVWDQARLNSDLRRALGGAALFVPQFDKKNRVRLPYEKIVEPASLTLIEGAYAYENDIQEQLSMLAVVSSSLHSRFMRKVARTINKTGRQDINESIQRYLRQTQGSLAFTWDRHLKRADVVFDNNPPFEISSNIAVDESDFSDNSICLTPKNGYGALAADEKLIIDSHDTCRLQLIHSVDGKVALSGLISMESYNDMREYYDEE